jgi:hypothetical protein
MYKVVTVETLTTTTCDFSASLCTLRTNHPSKEHSSRRKRQKKRAVRSRDTRSVALMFVKFASAISTDALYQLHVCGRLNIRRQVMAVKRSETYTGVILTSPSSAYR